MRHRWKKIRQRADLPMFADFGWRFPISEWGSGLHYEYWPMAAQLWAIREGLAERIHSE